jgi:hypothetical protein
MTAEKAGGMNGEPLKAVLKTVIAIESPVIEYGKTPWYVYIYPGSLRKS